MLTRPGQVVTWTLKSNHSSRLAWDIAVGPPKTLYDVTTLNKVGTIARKLDITWGGDWIGSIDRPHFEVKSTWKMPTGYKLEGQVIVPSSSKMTVQLIVEDKKEVNKVTQVWNPASPTMRTETENYIARAIKEGIIQDSHLKDLQSGVMTTDRLLGLYITIQQRRAN
ncbi:M15 family metallopeptidase [Lysinibacillus xylanilyticus]|uniref:M15 family metallopeptidase n=1 Tax=Lysinibacillus xylanilyticus TaxID=582475 RepID=UPI0038003D24